VDDIQLAGLALAKIILAACALGAGIFIGVKTANRTNQYWGWLAGLTTFVFAGVVLASAITAIDRRTCELDSLAVECK
jgi:hypothetical protein